MIGTVKKYIILLALALPFLGEVGAQRYFVTDQYVYDLFLVNPAASALHIDCYSVNGFFLKQWFGTDVSPTTEMLTFQKAYPSRLGIGSYIYNDRNGYHRDIGLQQTLSYGVMLSKTRRRTNELLFGMSFMVDQRAIEMGKYEASGEFDPVMSNDGRVGYGYNANAGVILLSNAWQFGFSATNIIPVTNSLYTRGEEPLVPLDMNFHIATTYKVPDRNLYVEPLFFYRRNNYLDSRVDMNIRCTMPSVDPSFAWWGVMAYRRTMDHRYGNNLGVAATLGVMKNRLSAGIEYQFGLTRAQYDYGSYFKLVVGYRVCRDRSKEPLPCSKDGVKVGSGIR